MTSTDDRLRNRRLIAAATASIAAVAVTWHFDEGTLDRALAIVIAIGAIAALLVAAGDLHRPLSPREYLRQLATDPAREQRAAAILSLAITLVLALTLYAALFEVDTAIEKGIFAGVVAFALGAAAIVHRVGTPTRRLPHSVKVRRERRHAAMLTGTLAGVLLLLAYTAAFDLNTWAEWTVFGGLAITAIGAGIAVQSRLR